MPSNILASGSTEASSSDITVTTTAKTVHGFGGGQWRLNLQIKNSAGGYTNVATLTDSDPSRTLYGPGVYRVNRSAGQTAGADQD